MTDVPATLAERKKIAQLVNKRVEVEWEDMGLAGEPPAATVGLVTEILRAWVDITKSQKV